MYAKILTVPLKNSTKRGEKIMLNIVGIKLYDTGEVAEMFKVNKTTIRGWIKSGILETVRIKRVYYISEDTLKRLVTPKPKQNTDV